MTSGTVKKSHNVDLPKLNTNINSIMCVLIERFTYVNVRVDDFQCKVQYGKL